MKVDYVTVTLVNTQKAKFTIRKEGNQVYSFINQWTALFWMASGLGVLVFRVEWYHRKVGSLDREKRAMSPGSCPLSPASCLPLSPAVCCLPYAVYCLKELVSGRRWLTDSKTNISPHRLQWYTKFQVWACQENWRSEATGSWILCRGGCSRRGVQWMGVVACSKTAYNLM